MEATDPSESDKSIGLEPWRDSKNLRSWLALIERTRVRKTKVREAIS
jgi:hypothetical protein